MRRPDIAESHVAERGDDAIDDPLIACARAPLQISLCVIWEILLVDEGLQFHLTVDDAALPDLVLKERRLLLRLLQSLVPTHTFRRCPSHPLADLFAISGISAGHDDAKAVAAFFYGRHTCNSSYLHVK